MYQTIDYYLEHVINCRRNVVTIEQFKNTEKMNPERKTDLEPSPDPIRFCDTSTQFLDE